MRYFTVTAKCGHVERDCYIPITFAVKANSAEEAASVTRFFPRVKHHHKDAILSVEEVDFSAYQDRCYINSFDPFLQCSNRQEQRQEALCPSGIRKCRKRSAEKRCFRNHVHKLPEGHSYSMRQVFCAHQTARPATQGQMYG